MTPAADSRRSTTRARSRPGKAVGARAARTGGRARRAAGPSVRVVRAQRAPQPKLPTFKVPNPDTGRMVTFRWPAVTRAWWKRWGESPLAEDLGATDWQFLLETAVLHAKYWTGSTWLGGELRLREAKFGATPEDRLRLRIQYEHADAAEDRGQRRRQRTEKPDPVDDPRRILHAVTNPPGGDAP